MNFEQSWEQLEKHNAFKITMTSLVSEMDEKLQSLVGKRDSDELTVEYNMLHRLLKVSYCYVDKAITVTIWQPKAVGMSIDIDLDKESLSVDGETFEECIIALAQASLDLHVEKPLAVRRERKYDALVVQD